MKSVKLIAPYFKENLFAIIFGVISLVILDILELFIPRIIKRAVDDLTAFQINIEKLMTYGVYIVLLAFIIGVLRYFTRRSIFGTSRKIEEGLRNNLFKHIQTLSASYFDNAKTGDLMAHATNDIQHIRMATGLGVVALTDAIFLGIAAVGFMLYINVKLTLLAMIPMPFIILSSRIFGRKLHRKYQLVQGSFSDLTESVRERFTGIRIIKSFNRETDEISNMEKVSKEYIGKNMGLVRITGSFYPMMLFFSNLSLALLLYIGGRQTILLDISPGDFVAFISYLGLITYPMMAMGWVTNLIQRGKASLDRIQTILQTPPDIKDSPEAKSILLPPDVKSANLMSLGPTSSDLTSPGLKSSGLASSGEITFEAVSFLYANRTKASLRNIDFKLSPGQILGIVGPQGAGKTTLLSLLPRLYDVTSGRILLDGTDIREIKIEELRSRISYMPQEPILFAGTIRENIALNAMLSDESQLIDTVRKACLDDTIRSFPNGFDTMVGERGVILSGGQKQRVALARALLNDTPVMVLDDPISQVDKDTGRRMIQAIRSLAPSKTVIIVSHRISAVQFSDNILVLDDGNITASGNHDKLMQSQPYYAKMYYMQEMENFNAL